MNRLGRNVELSVNQIASRSMLAEDVSIITTWPDVVVGVKRYISNSTRVLSRLMFNE